MKPLSYRAIIVAAVCGAAAALMVNSVMIGAGFGELNFSWMLGAVCLLVAAGAVWLGVQVARYRRIQTREKVPHMGPILAARAVAYAQGSIMTGALLTGWCAAILGYHVAMVSVRGFSVVFWEVLVNCVGSVALLIAYLWAQHCCRIPPEDDEDAASSSGAVKPREGGTYVGS